MAKLHQFWYISARILAIIIFILSVIPNPEIHIPSLSIWDKANHFIAHSTLAFAFVILYKPQWIKAIAICISFGICIELIQYFLPYRSFDLFDILANCIGTIFGTILAFTRLESVAYWINLKLFIKNNK